MQHFAPGWFGGLERCQFLVEMSADDARKRLEIALFPEDGESWLESAFATDRRYCGFVRPDRFEIKPIWRNRRFQATLRGRFEELDNGQTRVHFELEIDSKVLLPFMLPIIAIPLIVGLFLGHAMLPVVLAVGSFLVLALSGVMGTINALFARNESALLLQFFLKLYRDQRAS